MFEITDVACNSWSEVPLVPAGYWKRLVSFVGMTEIHLRPALTHLARNFSFHDCCCVRTTIGYSTAYRCANHVASDAFFIAIIVAASASNAVRSAISCQFAKIPYSVHQIMWRSHVMSVSLPLSVGPSDGQVRRTCPSDGPLVCPRSCPTDTSTDPPMDPLTDTPTDNGHINGPSVGRSDGRSARINAILQGNTRMIGGRVDRQETRDDVIWWPSIRQRRTYG
jgi:hypothetical protein